MINKLNLQNFRGFQNHELPLAPMTVLVGKNNAGKTTIVEALRLLSIVTLRYRNLVYRYAPSDTDLPRRFIGVSPSLKNVEINFKTIFNQYADPPGTLVASFSNGTSVTIFVLPENRIHCVIRDANGEIVRNREQAHRAELPAVRIMPQVAPLQRTETILLEDYVTAAMSSRLAPLHFRNQLRVRYDLFPEFKRVVEETWPGVQIREFIGRNRLLGEELHLHIRNEDFVAEVAEMGHGLQMWLQTMWFLTLARSTPTVILDEPDVYMHADLQRSIIRFLRNRHEQTIITTHSVEIMSEVQPDEILDAIATEFWANNRALGQAGANRAARERIRDSRSNCDEITPLASGKQILGLLSEWGNREFGVSFSATNIAREIAAHELHPEMADVVRSMENGSPFSGGPNRV